MLSAKRCLPILLIVIGALSARGQYTVGSTYYGTNNLIQYVYGNLPIIITAPHGGGLTGNLPDRTCPGITTATDTNTDDLAIALQNKLADILGKTPHLVVCRLRRTKLDVNRSVTEATCGNAAATTAYNEYHNFISTARNRVVQEYGKGLLIDIHGHGHTLQVMELGYNLSASQLANSDAFLNGSSIVAGSTIRSLANNNLTSVPHAALIRGPFSLGAYLQASGYPSVPSPGMPSPGSNPFFSGGYTVETWGSKNGGNIDAIQIETNYTGVRDNATNINSYATALANSLKAYLEKHYFAPAALPLKWRSFTAELDNRTARLKWITFDELNTKDFIVQHSLNGIAWDSVGVVAARGASVNDNQYTFSHFQLRSGINYYRLLQRDKDGKFSFSKVVTLQFTEPQIPLLAYPNPVKSGMVINFSRKITGAVSLFNSVGQRVFSLLLTTAASELSVPSLPAGIYTFKTETETIKIHIH